MILIVDSWFKSDNSNPFRVSEAFLFSYMIKDSHHMKAWSDKEIHRRIDKLKYDKTNDLSSSYWDSFKLVSFRRFRNTIICTYTLAEDDYKSPLQVYSAVLKPTSSSTYWERFKHFIHYKIPFGDKIFEMLLHKDRWLVVDFFTDDDFDDYEAYLDNLTTKDFYDFSSSLLERLDQKNNFENEWADREKKHQNEEIKQLYIEYLENLGSGSV